MVEEVNVYAATVLVLDGVRLHRHALRALLIDEGYVVYEAETIAGALHALQQVHPQVALVTVRLPDGNGYEATSRLTRADTDLRVVMAIGAVSAESVDAAQQSGAFTTVVKGDHPQKLLNAIRHGALLHPAARNATSTAPIPAASVQEQ